MDVELAVYIQAGATTPFSTAGSDLNQVAPTHPSLFSSSLAAAVTR